MSAEPQATLQEWRKQHYLRALSEGETTREELCSYCARWTDAAIEELVPVEEQQWVREHREAALAALQEG